MDIGLREWLIIGGVLVIGLIIFDGWRRMKGQRNTLKIDIDKGFSDSIDEAVPSFSSHNPELPNGGARMQKRSASDLYHVPSAEAMHSSERIDPGFEHLNDYAEPVLPEAESVQVEQRKEEVEESINVHLQDVELDPLFDDIPEILSPPRKVVWDEVDDEEVVIVNATIAAQQAPELLDLEQPITVLMRQASEKIEQPATPAEQNEMFANVSGSETHQEKEPPLVSKSVESEKLIEDDVRQDDSELRVFDLPQHEQVEDDEPEHLPEQDSLFEKETLEHARTDRKAREHVPEPEEVLVITVVGKQKPLNGQTLLQVVLACGMRFGDMNLFHRFEEEVDKGAVQFSMANAVNPGTFDLEHMSEMTTPGVSFFMSMSEPADVKNAFECMLATAETVSKHLGGDLLDENRSVMRPQTKAHYRERIREYEMHHRHRRQ